MPDIDPEDTPQDSASFGLIMPFVTVQSRGGPHEDNAYCCGWEMGTLDAILAIAADIATTVTRLIHAENEHQADLIAMRHGYTAKSEDSGTKGWLQLTLTKAARDA